MTIFVVLFTILFSYLFGSMNSAIVICRIMHGKDIREYGSNNAGLTNVLRTFGKLTAAITLVTDLVKGMAAVLICRIIADHFEVVVFSNPRFISYLAGILVIVGHIFPCYYGFRGGKGVLLTATTLLVIDPPTIGIMLAVFIITVSISKYVSLASILAGIVYPIATLMTQIMRGYETPWQNTLFALAVATIVIAKHHANIARLMNGTENKLSFKSKKQQ